MGGNVALNSAPPPHPSFSTAERKGFHEPDIMAGVVNPSNLSYLLRLGSHMHPDFVMPE